MGPILFLLYIVDLSVKIVGYNTANRFTDDLGLLVSCKNEAETKSILAAKSDIVEDGCALNRLCLYRNQILDLTLKLSNASELVADGLINSSYDPG